MTVGTRTQGAVAYVTLCRPEKRNALTLEMLRQLDDTFQHIAEDDSIRVVVLEGDGDSFCVGADVLEFAAHNANSARRTWIAVGHRATNTIATLPQPTVVAIKGHALGGGLELALACDFRVATTASVLGLPEVSIGTLPGWGGSARLAAAVGMTKAKAMVLLSDTVTGEQAVEIGLVTKAVPDDELAAAVDALAQRLAVQPAVALQLAKKVMSGPVAGSHELETFEALAGALSITTHDLHEGVSAFRAKRTPEFEGR